MYNVSAKLFASGLARGAGVGGAGNCTRRRLKVRQNSIAEKNVNRFFSDCENMG